MAGTPELRYTISMEDAGAHCFRVSLRLEGFRGVAANEETLRLRMPVWTPGSYLVREFARNVLEIGAKREDGTRLRVEKDSKNSWLVFLDGAVRVVVDYTVYAFVFGPQTSYLDSRHAVINGASVFLFVEGLEHEELRLRVVPPKSWAKVSTGLEPVDVHDPWEFRAPNYDILVDSPIEVGNQRTASFETFGVRHDVSIFCPVPIGEAKEDALVADLKRVVEKEVPIFGVVPYTSYLFLIDFGETARGGLEHLNSTLCIVSYFELDPPPEYRRMLSLFSHEFFHVWNVKRMRPLGLGPFDYSAETHTKSLWVAEGITSYYDDLVLRRAGMLSVPDYFDALCESINQVKSLPSSRLRSPEESSFNAWTDLYRPNENSPNTSPSYYHQGAVVALLLDLQIREATSSVKSLDDVMRQVYRQTAARESGYSEAEFRSAGEEISGGRVGEIFEKYVSSPEPIDFEKYLGYAGLTLAPKSRPGSRPEGFLGVKLAGASDRLAIQSRLVGSQAEKSDLSAGDEIIGMDGLRVDAQRLAFSIAAKEPGTSVKLLTSREGVLRDVRVILGAKPPMEYRIKKKESATAEEKALFSSWMEASWDSPLEYQDWRPSPLRRQVLDYI